MRTPHEHAEIIKAWADGYQIQGRIHAGDWRDLDYPKWDVEFAEFRVKPEPKPDVEDWQPNVRFEDGVYRFDLPNGDEFVIVPKQDEVVYGNAKSYENPCFLQTKLKDSNLKLTFDGETGKLKDAEVIK